MSNTQETAAQVDRRQEIANLVGEFYEKKSQEVAAQKPGVKPSRRPAYLSLALVITLTAWIYTMLNPPGAPPSVAELEQSARLTLYLAHLRIQEARGTSGKVPTSLAEARVDDPGIAFVRSSDSTYQISMQIGENTLTFSSGENPEQFLGAAAARLRAR